MPWAQAKVHTWLLFRGRKGADGAAGSQQNGGQGVVPHELARATLEGCGSNQQALILGEERLYSKKMLGKGSALKTQKLGWSG